MFNHFVLSSRRGNNQDSIPTGIIKTARPVTPKLLM